MIAGVLFLVALIGLVSCTGFLVLLVTAVVRFRKRKQLQSSPSPVFPPVTVLKPLCGLEAGLEENLSSFFQQDYPSFEVIFGTRDAADPALEVARKVAARYPQVPVKCVFSGEPRFANAKIWSLQKMYPEVSSQYLVISDSDIRVTSDYLRDVVRPLLDPKVGLVTCVYRGVPAGSIWSRLEALGMSVEMTGGVIVSDMLEGMTFALGPTMATRKDALEAIGGFPALADYYADDFVLGNEMAKSGRTVVLSTHIIENVLFYQTLKSSISHQVRWMRSTRFSRPLGHFSSVLSFATPFGILGMIAAFCSAHWALGSAILAWAVVNRMIMSVAAGWGVTRDRYALRDAWLYPIRDLMGFCAWCASYFSDDIVWRQGERFRFRRHGRMVRVLDQY